MNDDIDRPRPRTRLGNLKAYFGFAEPGLDGPSGLPFSVLDS